jgi:hypothetical protein
MHDSESEHVLSLFWGEFGFDWLTSLNIANIRRKVDRLLSSSNVDHREVRIHGEAVL